MAVTSVSTLKLLTYNFPSSPMTSSSSSSSSPTLPIQFAINSSLASSLPASIRIQSLPRPRFFFRSKPRAAMATGVHEALPPALTSTSEPPAVFDGMTRLYISYTCPFAQRAWITRNCKGLQEKIELVPINLRDRPTWYKEKVYPTNKVPALEHNGEVKGESLDLIKYIDTHFEGPSLFPKDPAKKAFAEEMLTYTDSFSKAVMSSFKLEEGNDAAASVFDDIETALSKFDDGPFFLGEFSLVDIAYAPFIERYHLYLSEVKKFDITAGRPKLAAWIEAMNKNEAFNQTRRDPAELLEGYKRRFLGQP